MLSERINKALNDQVAKEAYASSYYLALASWADIKGFQGTAQFFFNQAEEEREHMMKIFHFINEAEGHAIAPAVAQVPHEFPGYTDLFETALEHEKTVTKSIHELVKLATEENDFATLNLLQWFVDEQLEEESQMQVILDKLKLIGDNGVGLYMLDTELGNKANTSTEKA